TYRTRALLPVSKPPYSHISTSSAVLLYSARDTRSGINLTGQKDSHNGSTAKYDPTNPRAFHLSLVTLITTSTSARWRRNGRRKGENVFQHVFLPCAARDRGRNKR
ncbi:unnamed protein product, partial [Ectocarpus fasciculatus]